SFTDDQKKILEKYGRIVDVDIDTIENVGGGSARCMMAEIFLPKK
ncbi:MAG: amidinotransferase, partial [Ignavibacteria bacterium]|nr:amidinotransferase [Ignavibacteria bacterium]